MEKVLLDYPQITILDPKHIFCDDSRCMQVLDNFSLYADPTHLAPYGAQILAQELKKIINR